MEKQPTPTEVTSNGHEIKRPAEKMDADGYRSILETFRINGESPDERLEQLKNLSADRVAALISGINRGLQGSRDHLIKSDGAMKVGEHTTLAPEHRYDVFVKLIDDIKNTDPDINPARVADALAMGVVLLHPFHDGNGRTARVLGLMLRQEFDSESEYGADFEALSESRDATRQKGGVIVYGYTPRFAAGFDQSNPNQVSSYLHNLLTDDVEGSYIGPYGPATLKKSTAEAA